MLSFSIAGYSVSLSVDGSVLLAGAIGQNNYAGDAFVMKRNGATWSANPANPTTTSLASLLPGTIVLGPFSQFGIATGISGDGSFASVGANFLPYVTREGLAVTFSESPSQWSYNADITPSGLQPYYFYGATLSVAPFAPTVIVGADVQANGAAYVYDFY